MQRVLGAHVPQESECVIGPTLLATPKERRNQETRELKSENRRLLLKAIAVSSLLILVILGATVLTVIMLQSQRPPVPTHGWQRTLEVRIVIDSTADWTRIMFNDLYGGNTNGVRIVEFRGFGWLSGNDSNDRIDVGRSLTFVDIIYNTTVVKTGDIVGFFKGNNDFHHTRMYADLLLDINMDLRQVSLFLMLAGAGTTTFQILDKKTGDVIWQDKETGNSFTQFLRRWMSPEIFFAKEQIDSGLVIALVFSTAIIVLVLSPIRRGRRSIKRFEDHEGL